jgi:hypothetical protein
MRRFAVLALGALLASTLTPGRASAAGECPDGDWFCDPTPISDPAAAAEQPEVAAPADSAPDSAALPDSGAATSPQPERQIRIDVERVRPAVPRKQRRFREWGVNLHATLGLLAHEAAASGAGMNGLGAALRFRPIPHIAIEGALELVWGTDYNGYDRFEDAVLFSGLFFLNPRSAVQIYGLAGFGLGGAYLDSDGRLRDERYAYVGVQGGFGLEARITRHFAAGGDLIGFVRERNDRNAAENPEFVDPVSHRSTNRSGGGLVRLGATFYW